MRKFLIVLCLVLPVAILGQPKTSIVPMGKGIYLASQTGKSGFVPLQKIKRRVLEDVDTYAVKKNAEYEIISINETPQAFMVFPTVDVKFRLVVDSKELANPNSSTINISKDKDVYGNTTDIQISQDGESDMDKYKKLEKLGKLLKDGLITQEEFDKEKRKLLE